MGGALHTERAESAPSLAEQALARRSDLLDRCFVDALEAHLSGLSSTEQRQRAAFEAGQANTPLHLRLADEAETRAAACERAQRGTTSTRPTMGQPGSLFGRRP